MATGGFDRFNQIRQPLALTYGTSVILQMFLIVKIVILIFKHLA